MKDTKEPPPDAGFRITKIHAFLCINENDVEGVAGFMDRQGTFWPMVCADRERIESMRPIAQTLATAKNVQMMLAEFSVRTDVEIIDP